MPCNLEVFETQVRLGSVCKSEGPRNGSRANLTTSFVRLLEAFCGTKHLCSPSSHMKCLSSFRMQPDMAISVLHACISTSMMTQHLRMMKISSALSTVAIALVVKTDIYRYSSYSRISRCTDRQVTRADMHP